MSGGHFDGKEWQLTYIDNELDDLLKGEKENERELIPEAYDNIRKTKELLAKAFTQLSRLDYYISGDDGDESYVSRLKEELEAIEKVKDGQFYSIRR